MQFELIRYALTSLGSGERNLTQQHYEKISALATQNTTGKTIQLPSGFSVLREYQKLIFSKTQTQQPKLPTNAVTLHIPGTTSLSTHNIATKIFNAANGDIEKFKAEKADTIEWFDLKKIKLPLKVRSRQQGDRFTPFGQNCEKRVGKFLTTEKITPKSRYNLLIIEDAEKIIWVAPLRPSQKTALTPQTTQILQLEIIPQ